MGGTPGAVLAGTPGNGTRALAPRDTDWMERKGSDKADAAERVVEAGLSLVR